MATAQSNLEAIDAKLLITGKLCWISDEAEATRIARHCAVEQGVLDDMVAVRYNRRAAAGEEQVS